MALPNPLYAMVIDTKHRPTKTAGRFFWQLTLNTTYGEIKGIMWDAPPEGCVDNLAFPQIKDIIQLTGFKDELQQYGSIKVDTGGFIRIGIDDLPGDERRIAEAPKASPEEMAWAKKILFDPSIWSDEIYFKFIKRCFAKLDKTKLMQSPAASGVHHTYQGGLLVHTAEVLELCQVMAAVSSKRYGFINKDVLFTAAILHDIGKIRTYQINEMGLAESLYTEKSIGHMVFGMILIQEVSKEMEISKDFIDEILHAVASHHGRIEWGSIKECQSVEAGILSRADYISSRNGMMEKKLKEYVDNKREIEAEFKIYGDLYFGSIGIKEYLKTKIEKLPLP